MNNTISSAKLYKEYMQKVGDRTELFELLGKNFDIESALYPGSYIDITPSFFYRKTVYIDNFKKTEKFFAKRDLTLLILKDKKYEGEPILKFYFRDYTKNIEELDKNFDLLISLYAGFVSKYCKKYLKKEGLLLVNNSHGDASMADLDEEFSIFGVIYRSNRKLYLNQKNLEKYFVPKKEREISVEYLEKLMKGIGYKKTASFYLFKKV
ncbi:MAG: hypothetical protein WBH31_17960 [Promethearchaeia archaeon]